MFKQNGVTSHCYSVEFPKEDGIYMPDRLPLNFLAS